MSKSPGLAATPPRATKIFLLASTSRELRCQCPIVTPASFGGAGCARAVPAARLDTSQSADINAFMGRLPVGFAPSRAIGAKASIRAERAVGVAEAENAQSTLRRTGPLS